MPGAALLADQRFANPTTPAELLLEGLPIFNLTDHLVIFRHNSAPIPNGFDWPLLCSV